MPKSVTLLQETCKHFKFVSPEIQMNKFIWNNETITKFLIHIENQSTHKHVHNFLYGLFLKFLKNGNK